MINRGELEGRFDAAFYIGIIAKLLKNSIYNIKTLKEVVLYIKTGFASGQNDQAKNEKGIIQIRPTNLDNNGLLKFNKNIFVPFSLIKEKQNNLLCEDEVLFNNTNSQEWVGKTSYFDLKGNYFCSNHITRIKTNEFIHPKYLWILLNLYQKYKVFFNSCTNWNNQSGVNNELLKSYKIPVPNKTIQQNIIHIMDNAYLSKKKKEQESKALFDSIDEYLLNKLGINLPDEPENNIKNRTFKIGFDEVFNSRLCSSYHTEYFKKLIININNSSYELVKIKEHINFLSGYSFSSDDYVKDGVKLIRIKNLLSDGNINLRNSTKLPLFFIGRYKDFRISKKDILIAMTGATIGKVSYFDFDDEVLLNQRVGAIRTQKTLNSKYLFSILHSNIYNKLILRESSGGAQPNISQYEIQDLKIPLPNLDIQNEIVKEISKRRHRARKLKYLASKILEKAKKEVETIILGESYVNDVIS